MKKLICLIQEDSRLAKLTEEKLSHLGFEMKHFISGEQYLEHHDKGLQALYLVNEKLPGIQGVDLIKNIRQTSPLAPIIMLTDSEEENIIHMFKAGADDYQLHPILFEELAAKVIARWNKFSVLNNQDIIWKEWGSNSGHQ